MRLIGYLVILLVNLNNRLILAQYPNLKHLEVMIPSVRGDLYSNVRKPDLIKLRSEFPGFIAKGNQRKSYFPLNEPEDRFEYDEFPEMPPFLELYSGENNEAHSVNRNSDLRKPHQKRYLGIDIPDYISNGGKENAIKDMSNKMKAVGKRK